MQLNSKSVGKKVRILGIPDLSGMPRKTRKETESVFRYLVSKRKTIQGVDRVGNAELEFRILKGPMKGSHLVAIEPSLLVESP
jgi:hypothetical protein